jgi:hypothetical protein
LSEPRILFCSVALDAAEAVERLEVLRQVASPTAAKYLATFGKFDGQGHAKMVNIEADYPAEPAQLQTLERWAEIPDAQGQHLRDGSDLYCLRRVLAKASDAFDYAVLLRSKEGHERCWAELVAKVEDKLFLAIDDGLSALSDGAARGDVLFRTGHNHVPEFLKLAWELYATGTVYGMTPYGFEHALNVAAGALRLKLEIDNQ